MNCRPCTSIRSFAFALTLFFVVISAFAQDSETTQDSKTPQSTSQKKPSNPTSDPLVRIGTIIAAILGAALAGGVQEIFKQKIVEGYNSPPHIGKNDQRNSIIALGLSQVGKTTLIREIIGDEDANPSEMTNEYAIYSKQTIVRDTSHHMYISDYAGQDVGSLISAFLLQQKKRFSPMSYGHINSVILMVDLFAKPNRDDPDPDVIDIPLQDRVNENLKQWNDLVIDAVFGLLTEDTFKYFCLFISKADLLQDQSANALKEYEELFAPLRDRIIKRARKEKQKIEVNVIVGSAKQGGGIRQLQEKLREHSLPGQKQSWLPWS